MGQRPKSKQNGQTALKLAKKVLYISSGLLVLVGKPVYFIISTFITLTTQFLNIIGKIITNKFQVPKIIYARYLHKTGKKIKRKGIIFDSRELSKFIYKKKLSERVSKLILTVPKKLDKISWNYHVLILAIPKILIKGSKELSKAKISPKNLTKLLLLKLRILLIRIVSSIPEPSKPKISYIKILTVIFSIFFFAGFFASLAFWFYILKDLPSPQILTTRNINVSTKIYDRNGVLLYTIYKDQNRTPIKLTQIPPQVKYATLAIEDAEFYDHIGFSPRGIARAILKNIEDKELSGGSTITQQLVKNALLSSEKTVIRKIKELTLAIQVELRYSKDEILEMYLNEVSYGGTAYGIQEAARTYFTKDVDQLTLGEAALLAGLPKSPSQYSPFGANPETAFTRQKEVLHLMKVNSFISKEQEEKAKNEEIKFAPHKVDLKAPHFVMYVRGELENKYGPELTQKGGLEVITSLDYEIQKLAEKIVQEEVDKLKNLNVKNGAAIVLNPRTGEILAMVGSRDYFDSENDGNVNITTSLRQPGSSIKV